jgi:hypothetical protein
MKTLKLLFLGSVFLFFLSCEKKDVAKNESPTDPPSSKVKRVGDENERLSSIYNPENPANPVDEFGFRHNEDLDYIFANIGPDSNHMDATFDYIESVYGAAARADAEDQVEANLNFPPTRPGNPPVTTHGQRYYSALNTFTAQSFKNAINGFSLSPTAKAKLVELVDILTDTLSHDIADYDVVKPMLVTWEASVAATWTGSARDVLLGTGAVARYSLDYWHTYEQSLGSSAARRPGGFLRWLGWGLIGTADAIGFFVGGGGIGGVAMGAAGSWLGFKIFKKRGWRP